MINPEFGDFAEYVHASGLEKGKAEELFKLAQAFLLAINSSPPNLNSYKGREEEIFCALAWFLMYQALQQGEPFHKGMFLLDLGDSAKNKACFEFFSNYSKSQKRPSSHFNKKYNKQLGSYGITPEKHTLPGPVKKSEGLEKLTTGLFMLLDEPDGRMALKYEDFPFDLKQYPKETVRHSITWIAGTKINTDEVVGRREDAYPPDVLEKLKQEIKIHAQGEGKLASKCKKVNEKLEKNRQSKKNKFEIREEENKIIFDAFGYLCDMPKEFALFNIPSGRQSKHPRYGSEVHVNVNKRMLSSQINFGGRPNVITQQRELHDKPEKKPSIIKKIITQVKPKLPKF